MLTGQSEGLVWAAHRDDSDSARVKMATIGATVVTCRRQVASYHPEISAGYGRPRRVGSGPDHAAAS